MKLSDHPLIWFSGALATVAAGSWGLSQKVRVEPLEGQIKSQEGQIKFHREMLDEARGERDSLQTRLNTLSQQRAEGGKSDPVILSHTTAPTADGVRTQIQFRDAEGDANHISFVLVRSTAKDSNLKSGPIVQSEQQKRGSQVETKWRCEGGSYSVTQRAYITDAAGNVSQPHEFTVSCG
jgi:hypothetical protein